MFHFQQSVYVSQEDPGLKQQIEVGKICICGCTCVIRPVAWMEGLGSLHLYIESPFCTRSYKI